MVLSKRLGSADVAGNDAKTGSAPGFAFTSARSEFTIPGLSECSPLLKYSRDNSSTIKAI